MNYVSGGAYDIEIHAGADFVMTLTIRDEEGNLMDLTGAEATAQLRETPEATDHFDFTITHNDDGGQILMRMTPDLTERIPFTDGSYDVFLTTSEETMKVTYGKAKIVPSVTH